MQTEVNKWAAVVVLLLTVAFWSAAQTQHIELNIAVALAAAVLTEAFRAVAIQPAASSAPRLVRHLGSPLL
jgi:hypothetical protein